MDPSMDVVEVPKLHPEKTHSDAQLIECQESYLHAKYFSSMITLHEHNPSAQWKLPSILPKEVYKFKWYKYVFVT